MQKNLPAPVSYTHLEVAVGFGLRQQAVADKAEGLPVDFVDPTEGNFSLTESVAAVSYTHLDVYKRQLQGFWQ